MFDPIPNKILRELWKHQRNALAFAIDHLNSLATPCLIRMPTGTGKTGIIACLARLSNPGSTLVLTPWAHLRIQMVADVNRNFWRAVGATPKERPVVDLFPSTASKVLASSDPQVLVATFATLNDLRRNNIGVYEELSRSISLAIVDEGHYEPAVEWGKSVKGLEVRTVLLTATPYRNDLKLFRITNAARSTFHFTHKQAVENGIIRELRFERLASTTDIAALSTSFAKKWKEATTQNLLPSRTPRAIVCCSSAADIETAVRHLRKAGLNAVGVHEQFSTAGNLHLHKEVPDVRRAKYDIWVHQHKLTEGVDDHRFCCLALFAAIRNDRKLIQQIGRTLRRDSGDKALEALVVAPQPFDVEDGWQAYREFEVDLALLEPQHFRRAVDAILTAQPPVEYFDGRFRRRFDPHQAIETPRVIIPPSVTVHAISSDFALSEYVEDCTDTLNTEDAVILGPTMNAPWHQSADHALWVYASVGNSRLLGKASLYEITLETHCVVVTGGFLFIADSKGYFPLEYVQAHTISVPASTLTRFLDKTFRPTHVSVDSSIPYDTVVRGAELRGHNLLGIAASLTDRIQICRSARGSSRKHGRRYVGVMSGRLRSEISQEQRQSFALEAFLAWTGDVAAGLNSKIAPSPLFKRFMPASTPPAAPVPKTICVDLLSPDITVSLPDGRECWLVRSGVDVVPYASARATAYLCTFKFEGKGASSASASLRIEYQAARRRFWFHKHSGESVRISVESNNKTSDKSLAEFLNQKQEVVLIGLDGGEMVYQGRNFYSVDYSHAERVLLDRIKRPTTTLRYATEKGSAEQIAALRNSKTKKFPVRSLFRAIADQHMKLPFDPRLLICDDLGSECADFVAADFGGRKLALIHAKSGGGARISASAFHDVVAQAMKNLVYLTRNSEVPAGIRSWKRDATWYGTSVPRLLRAPSGTPTEKALFEKLKAEIVGSSDPELYVILVTSGCCDVHALREAVGDPNKRTPETAQLFHLLDGLNSYARQLGVSLSVYDLPYKSP